MKNKFHRKIRKLKESDVTDLKLYMNRKSFIESSGRKALTIGLAMSPAMDFLGKTLGLSAGFSLNAYTLPELKKLNTKISSNYAKNEDLTKLEYITGYNNFYEFSTGKEEVAEEAKNFITSPWKVKVEGEVEKAAEYDVDDLIKPFDLEERIYRLRCVEGWSMVIPWIGIPLSKILNRIKPTSSARFIEFTTLYNPKQMPGQRRSVLDWPYVEGLRLDEAMNPLTILSVGLYGKVLPNQNGAPIRLVVPWKYGFKSIKSIVKIKLTKKQPVGTWERANPREYGFYSNVNPEVDHPRWSQARERRIGEFRKRDTLLFNGYADEVGHMYRNLDLKKYY